ncbi:unnamed protein product [Cyprideis torosa]|uniref:Uncharacterized protein n=1 Tax=Cyprideis torosa TaxID=163714 RepID=A0A7R8ZJL9_9CRUS|nr:unnamed protein product [Cyprideis torosa]CAG0887373.1 unnamed protein product [Cyprideis torosa]
MAGKFVFVLLLSTCVVLSIQQDPEKSTADDIVRVKRDVASSSHNGRDPRIFGRFLRRLFFPNRPFFFNTNIPGFEISGCSQSQLDRCIPPKLPVTVTPDLWRNVTYCALETLGLIDANDPAANVLLNGINTNVINQLGTFNDWKIRTLLSAWNEACFNVNPQQLALLEYDAKYEEAARKRNQTLLLTNNARRRQEKESWFTVDVGDVDDITDTDITDSRRRHLRQSSPTSPTVVADIPDSRRRHPRCLYDAVPWMSLLV